MGRAWVLALWAVALLAVVFWFARRPNVPTVREIQADGLTYEDLVRRLKRVSRVTNAHAYARTMYRRAYGHNPDDRKERAAS